MTKYPTYGLDRWFTIYRVVQNKPDYLLLLSKFCISTRKHIRMIMNV